MIGTSATWLILFGLTLTLAGSAVAALGGILNKDQIAERVKSAGMWNDEPPAHVSQDLERTSSTLRRGLWLIAAGTVLQIIGTANSLLS